MSKYWVKYRWCIAGRGWQEPVSCFITTGDDQDSPDLESWWIEESSEDLPHELLEVVKL